MLTDTEETRVRQICRHLLECDGVECHTDDGVEQRRQMAIVVLSILDGETDG